MATKQDCLNQIDRIEGAKSALAEAIEEKGVEVPQGTSINSYPGLVRQIQTGSPNAVLFTPQELDTEQQGQARENIGAGTYSKPGNGIPDTDLAQAVKTSLGKANTALQPAALEPITELIPEQATAQNKLADKNFVNSSIATNTANYISDNGQPFTSVADLEAYSGTLTNNDYAFVVGTDAAGNTTYTRYKYNATTGQWAEEFVLNNSSFTAAQWAAISSGITALLVQKLSDLPTEVVTYVVQTLTEAQKQQVRENIGAENIGNKVNTIIGNESDTSKFPTTKAVADFAVQALTASGKKIWAGTQADYALITPANDTVYFIIPAL